MIDFINTLQTKDALTLITISITLIIGLLNLFNGIRINKRTLFVNAITSERVRWMGELKQLLSEYLSLTTIYDKKPLLEQEEATEYFERLIYLKAKIRLHLNYSGEKDKEINKLIDLINNKIFSFYEVKDILEKPKEERLSNFPELLTEELFESYLKSKTEVDIKNKLGDTEQASELIEDLINFYNKDFKEKYGYKGRDDLISYTEKLAQKSGMYLKEEWERVKDEAQKGKLKKHWVIRFAEWLREYFNYKTSKKS